MSDAKPPTLVIGVRGIESSTPGARALESPRDVNAFLLAKLPPFQMFAREMAEARDSPGGDAEEQALSFIARQDDFDALFARYARWHAGKGLWPNESPWGGQVSGIRSQGSEGSFSGSCAVPSPGLRPPSPASGRGEYPISGGKAAGNFL
jgi:hypothetical protein